MLATVQTLGYRCTETAAGLGRITFFAAHILTSCLARVRLRRMIDEFYAIGVLSLVIVGVSGAAVGMVLGLQGYNTLSRFGAAEALGSFVGLTLIRELGPVLTSLLVTGRAGSSIAAELGEMVATEQLDGLRMMSVNPVGFVVAPKAIAMVLVMPLLSALFIVSGLLGGYMAGSVLLGVDPGSYLSSLESRITFVDDVVGSVLKSVVFGLLVGLIATYRGYTAAPGAEGVSRATTSTVVAASVSTLIVDYFITALWGI